MINLKNLPIGKFVVVGSTALATRAASDIDVICYKEDVQVTFDREDDYIGSFSFEGRRVECLFADNQESLSIILNSTPDSFRMANKIELYIIKAGHIFIPSRKWEKHMCDYAMLKEMVDKAYPYNNDAQLGMFNGNSINKMIKLHRDCTNRRINVRKTPKLKSTDKSTFFNDKVIKYVDHDEIHNWMAYRELPMYTYMQLPGSDVECSEKLWKDFTYEQKVQCVLEESYVIASERILIPKIIKGSPIGAYASPFPYSNQDVDEAVKWALMRICTTLCSGWFRQFAVDNYFNISNSIDYTYHLKIKADRLDKNYGVSDRM